jgi:hypothetical protein
MMKTCRFLFLLGALLGLSGCPDTPCFGSGGSTPRPSSPRLALVGEQVRLQVPPSTDNDCSDEQPESLSVEVYGPDNLLVPSQGTLGNPASAVATVRFTPDKPGRYHVFAAFDPIGGIQQFDLYAARNRSAEAQAFPLPQPCYSLERTQRGGWMCDLQFFRDGTLVKGFSSGRMAVAGDVVWVVTSGQVQRYVDTGTTLELTATKTTTPQSASFLIATENELLVLRNLTIERHTYTGAPGLNTPGTVQLPSIAGVIGSTGIYAILVRSGDRLGVVTNAPSSGGPPPPPNTFTSQVCSYRIEPDRILRTTEPCQTFTGNLVGYEPGVLWAATPFAFGDELSDLRRLEWTAAGGLAEQASLPLGTNFKLATQTLGLRNQVVPVVTAPISGVSSSARATVAIYSPERRSILLEMLDAEMGGPSASATLLWTSPNAVSSTPRARVRPTTP